MTFGRRLLVAVLGLAVAVIASRILGAGSAHLAAAGWGPASLTWLGYLCVWVPLGAAVVVVLAVRGRGHVRVRPRGLGLGQVRGIGFVTRLGLHRWFTPLDLAIGVIAGLVARAVTTVITVALTGYTGLDPQPQLGGPPSAALLFVMVAAPVVLAPLVEEVFFRGVLLGALAEAFAPAPRPGAVVDSAAGPAAPARDPAGTAAAGTAAPARVSADPARPAAADPARLSRGAGDPAGHATADPAAHSWPGRLALWTAALVTAVAFGALHVLVEPTAPAVLTFASTFVFAVFAGGLVATTRRLGGAVVAHVVFNGVAVLLTWPF